jgi:diguanylate cyclase (GGDEF)-like protein/PAS domain S-box-containing protein
VPGQKVFGSSSAQAKLAMKAPLPPNEAQRLETLRGYDVLDTPPESAFDDLTLLAAQICQVPIALVTLIDESRQWFKSKIGLSATETSRDFSFCAHAILYTDEVFEVRDAQLDPRFADNPLVTADPYIRFYAGALLVAPDGLALGTLCVIDRVPRVLSAEQQTAMRALSRTVIAQLELRRTLVAHRRAEEQLQSLNASLEQKVDARTAELRREMEVRRESEQQYRTLADSGQALIWAADTDKLCNYFNKAWLDFTGRVLEQELGNGWAEGIHPDDSQRCLDVYMSSFDRREKFSMDYRLRRYDGEYRWIQDDGCPRYNSEGEFIGYIGYCLDITGRKQDEELIQRLAHFDVLTGLPNRVLFTDRIIHALSMAQRSQGQLAVLFLDLDHFKNVNDTLGHRIGDALLIEVAKRLKSAMREGDTASRLGGDEFILVLPGTDVNGAVHVAEKLLETVAQHCQIEQHELVITPSIGIAMYPDDGEDFDTLSKCADVAMYRAKRDGRNNYRFFTQEMQTHSARTLQLENALRHALKRDQLYLHYQPQMSLQDGRIIGAEALLRWQHPEFGMVSPAEFIPIAESSGQILQIGEWVLRTAAHQMKSWMDSGLAPMIIGVNLSAVQFRHPNLPELVTQILDAMKLPPQYLELELTEGVAMDDPLGAIAVMDSLHERGIRMSIDDFGTGYSSLSYLKRFRVYKLKIDQSFVRDITDDPEDKAIVSAIISLASSLGLQTIAEGVETEGQLAFLREQGCNEVQGYYFSKPLPAEQFEAFVRGKSQS